MAFSHKYIKSPLEDLIYLILGFQRVDSPFGRGLKGDSVSLVGSEKVNHVGFKE